MRICPIGIGRVRVVALVVMASLTIAGSALAAVAAKPEKGKTYSGTVERSGTSISFRVSKTGKSVNHFNIQAAPFIFCQGGGVNPPKSRSARVSSNGTFKVKLPLKSVNGKPAGHMSLTGKFAKDGNEAGKVTVVIKHLGSCDGSSAYSTKAG